MRILAGIVLYNPNINRLVENIEGIVNQVDELVLVDNGSNNRIDILNLLNQKKYNCKYIDLSENRGIAFALNVILNYAEKNKYDWFLTLDQDSVACDDLIETYRSMISDDVGILSCKIVDRNFTENEEKTGVEIIDFAITSGALNNVKACLQVNGFDYGMFIDFVDFDICAKLRFKGYKIIRTYETSILHELGNSKPVRILGKQYIVYNHSPFRIYYFFRNCSYFIKKHKNEGTVNSFAWKKNMLRHLILITFYEKHKLEKYKMIVQGLHESRRMGMKELGYAEMEYENVLF